MRTTYHIRQPIADRFLEIAKEAPCQSKRKPDRFIDRMRQNRGGVGILTGMGLDEDGLERKNPVIAALGDSVTAGHFEPLTFGDHTDWFAQVLQRANVKPHEIELYSEAFRDPARLIETLTLLGSKIPDFQGFPPMEIVDVRESYVEKFRMKLIDRYEETSVSAINAGIAGDNLIMMEKRLFRDVIRYQPDLVLINGSLNWSDEMGDTAFYKTLLTGMVQRIQAETEADIILLTPNGMVGDAHSCEMLEQRVEAIREVAREQEVCLADTYAIWKEARNLGCPWEEMLANRRNHPSPEGHEVYALTLMKLFE